VYGNRIYLVYESKTGIFGTGDQDFVLTIIDLRTGVELLSKVYGSARDDAALDLVVNQLGVYVMANVGNGFKDKDSPDDYSTQNGKITLHSSLWTMMATSKRLRAMIQLMWPMTWMETIQKNS
jgi:hypothetical protein